MAKKTKKSSPKKFKMTKWVTIFKQPKRAWVSQRAEADAVMKVWTKSREVPEGTTWERWFSQWLVSNMVMKAHEKTKKIPKQLRIRDGEECIEKQPDGSGLLYYEVRF